MTTPANHSLYIEIKSMSYKRISSIILCTTMLSACGEASDKSTVNPSTAASVSSIATAPISTSISIENEQNTAAVTGNILPAIEEQGISYGIGVYFGENLRKRGVNVDYNSFLAGVKDGVEDNPLRIDKAELANVMAGFQKRMVAKRNSKQEASRLAYKADGEQYLVDNGKKTGVLITPSGLQYKVLVPGQGFKPTANDTVKVHYQGSLINGEVFDSSIKRGNPVTFPLTGVIAGWTEALQLMPVGARWELVIPYELGYGAQGNGLIAPYSTLVFEVELLSIQEHPGDKK
jgi:FKBP-type peptidyl-prolyl cis-trans isomerase FklB